MPGYLFIGGPADGKRYQVQKGRSYAVIREAPRYGPLYRYDDQIEQVVDHMYRRQVLLEDNGDQVEVFFCGDRGLITKLVDGYAVADPKNERIERMWDELERLSMNDPLVNSIFASFRYHRSEPNDAIKPYRKPAAFFEMILYLAVHLAKDRQGLMEQFVNEMRMRPAQTFIVMDKEQKP